MTAVSIAFRILISQECRLAPRILYLAVEKSKHVPPPKTNLAAGCRCRSQRICLQCFTIAPEANVSMSKIRSLLLPLEFPSGLHGGNGSGRGSRPVADMLSIWTFRSLARETLNRSAKVLRASRSRETFATPQILQRPSENSTYTKEQYFQRTIVMLLHVTFTSKPADRSRLRRCVISFGSRAILQRALTCVTRKNALSSMGMSSALAIATDPTGRITITKCM